MGLAPLEGKCTLAPQARLPLAMHRHHPPPRGAGAECLHAGTLVPARALRRWGAACVHCTPLCKQRLLPGLPAWHRARGTAFIARARPHTSRHRTREVGRAAEARVVPTLLLLLLAMPSAVLLLFLFLLLTPCNASCHAPACLPPCLHAPPDTGITQTGVSISLADPREGTLAAGSPPPADRERRLPQNLAPTRATSWHTRCSPLAASRLPWRPAPRPLPAELRRHSQGQGPDPKPSPGPHAPTRPTDLPSLDPRALLPLPHLQHQHHSPPPPTPRVLA